MAPSSPAEGTLSRGWPAVRHPFTMGSMTGLAVILLIVGIVLLLVGALPTWPHSRAWGYGPSGLLGVILVVVLILLLLGRI